MSNCVPDDSKDNDPRPDIIVGFSAMPCAQCGNFYDLKSGKLHLIESLNDEPTILCDSCIKKILEESEE